MKKNIKKIIMYLILSLLIFSLTGCKNDYNDDKSIKEKVDSEIKYIDLKFIEMLNKVNGISFDNYSISVEKIEETSSSSNNETDSSSKDSSSSKPDDKTSNSDSAGKGQNTNNNVKYNMNANNILTKDRIADWEFLKNEVEKFYSTWSTIILDLYKINIDNQEILNFNTDIDNLTMNVKDKDKNATLNSIAKLYSYIPEFYKSYSENKTQTIIYETKSNIINAYAIIEQDKLPDVKRFLSEAENVYLPILNDLAEENNQFNINKVYILLKDIQSSIDINDIDIFYIKYKNLIEELSII